MLEILIILLVMIFPVGIAYGSVQSTFKSVGGLATRKALLFTALILLSLLIPILLISSLEIEKPLWNVIFFVIFMVASVLVSGYLIKKMTSSEFTFKGALVIYWGIFWRFSITWMVLGAIVRLAKLAITKI